MKVLFIRHVVAAVGMAVALAMSAGSAGAITTHTFEGTVIGGPFAGTTGSGSFTFDETLLTGIGDEFLTPLARKGFSGMSSLSHRIFGNRHKGCLLETPC